jgi:hypothetical protein
VLITPSLGVSNWAAIYKTPTSTLHHQVPMWSHLEIRIKSKHSLKHSRTLRTEPPIVSSRKISFNTIGVVMVVAITTFTFISFHIYSCVLHLFAL